MEEIHPAVADSLGTLSNEDGEADEDCKKQ